MRKLSTNPSKNEFMSVKSLSCKSMTDLIQFIIIRALVSRIIYLQEGGLRQVCWSSCKGGGSYYSIDGRECFKITRLTQETAQFYIPATSNRKKRKKLFWGPRRGPQLSFIPYYFEFWQGHENRLNKRHVFEQIDNEWVERLLQP